MSSAIGKKRSNSRETVCKSRVGSQFTTQNNGVE